MKPRHQVSRAAIELIKSFEGYRRKAAQLPDGRWTIGYGHTLTAREGAEVSENDAEALLMYDLITVAHAVNEHSYTPLTQNQFDALCCFAFNIGTDNFRRSSVLRRVNEGQLLQAACAMEMWRKADFEGERIVVDALVRRRSAEKTLFLTPVSGWVPAPSPVLRPKVDYDAVNAAPRDIPARIVATTIGDQIVTERDDSPQPRPVAPPVEPLATERAAASVGAQLEQLMPEPAVVAPQAPQPQPVEDGEDAFDADAAEAAVEVEAESEPTWTPQPSGPTVFVMDAPGPDGLIVENEEPAIVTEAGPVQLAEQIQPLPVLEMAGGDQTFILTPAPETLVAAPSEAAFVAEVAEFAPDAGPGLFDVTAPEIAAGPSRPLVSEDHIRRLVRQDEYATMADDLDPAFIGTALEPVRIKGLPLMVLAVAGVGFFAGGVYWALQARAGEGVTGALTIGLAVAVGGALLFGAAVYLFLKTLANAPIEDEDDLTA